MQQGNHSSEPDVATQQGNVMRCCVDSQLLDTLIHRFTLPLSDGLPSSADHPGDQNRSILAVTSGEGGLARCWQGHHICTARLLCRERILPLPQLCDQGPGKSSRLAPVVPPMPHPLSCGDKHAVMQRFPGLHHRECKHQLRKSFFVSPRFLISACPQSACFRGKRRAGCSTWCPLTPSASTTTTAGSRRSAMAASPCW